jgi:hypothetical protein
MKEKKQKKSKVDKKSKFDPYAYVPLDRKALNKRKKMKMGNELKNIVQAAKRGSTKGRRRRLK